MPATPRCLATGEHGPAAGFSLISAIFLLVVLAALGAVMVRLSTTQHTTAALDVQSARALSAARAGLEWAAWRAMKDPTYACTTAGSSNDTVSLPGDLASFTTTVTCSKTEHAEAGNTLRVYSLTAKSETGVQNTPWYVKREVTMTLAR